MTPLYSSYWLNSILLLSGRIKLIVHAAVPCILDFTIHSLLYSSSVPMTNGQRSSVFIMAAPLIVAPEGQGLGSIRFQLSSMWVALRSVKNCRLLPNHHRNHSGNIFRRVSAVAGNDKSGPVLGRLTCKKRLKVVNEWNVMITSQV